MTTAGQYLTCAKLTKRARQGRVACTTRAGGFTLAPHDTVEVFHYETVEEALAFLEGYIDGYGASRPKPERVFPSWMSTFDFKAGEAVTYEEVNRRYRQKAKQADSDQVLLDLNLARDEAMRDLE